jgi:hypothetical protein
MKDTIKRTAAGGTIGFLGGVLVEHGIEALTGADFVNGVCEIAGAAMGAALVNRDLVETAYAQIQRQFGKEPAEITKDEWNSFKQDNPNTAKYLEKALAI